MNDKALKLAEYLREELRHVSETLTEQSYEHARVCLVTGKPSRMCLTAFDNLDRVCSDVIRAIQSSDDRDDGNLKDQIHA